MSKEQRKQSKREAGAKHLFDLVCHYVSDSFGMPETLKKELYFKSRSAWYSYCDRNNSKGSRLVEFDRAAFKRLVDRSYIDFTKKFHPGISMIKLLMLKTKTHSYA